MLLPPVKSAEQYDECITKCRSSFSLKVPEHGRRHDDHPHGCVNFRSITTTIRITAGFPQLRQGRGGEEIGESGCDLMDSMAVVRFSQTQLEQQRTGLARC